MGFERDELKAIIREAILEALEEQARREAWRARQDRRPRMPRGDWLTGAPLP